MKGSMQVFLLSISVVATSTMAEGYDLALEPCINGAVSASGLFPNQAAEGRHFQNKKQAAVLGSEPCIHGDV